MSISKDKKSAKATAARAGPATGTTSGKPRVVAIIPARFASQRLPGKPLAEIGGKPMIRHVYERVARASLVNTVLVATDDERIAAAVRGFGGHAVMTPDTLQTGTDRVAYAATSLPDADIILNVQGDEPLIPAAMIDEAVKPLTNDGEVLCATLVRRIAGEADLLNPAVVKVVCDRSGNALFFSRSPIPFGRDFKQGAWAKSHTYYKHIGIYVFRRDFLMTFAGLPQTPLERTEQLEQLRILEHGYRIRAVVTEYDSISVDTVEDLERIRTMVRDL